MSCKCKFHKRLLKSKTEFYENKTIYFDYNATTPVDPAVLGAFEKACRLFWQNPSSLHSGGIKAWEYLEASRKKIQDYFNFKNAKFNFCSSGSEALHAGITGIINQENDRVVITTKIEHSAVNNLCSYLEQSGKKIIYLDVNENGEIRSGQLKKELSKYKKTLLVFSPVNHETGSVQPYEEIYKIAKNFNTFIFFDAVQTAPRIHSQEWIKYCDMFAVSAHKLYAPKGSAFLALNNEIKIAPFRFGGSQEDGIFPGTENVPGIASFSSAIEILNKNIVQEINRIKILTKEGIEILKSGKFNFNIETPENSAPGILCISLPWINNMENFMYRLNEKNICLSRFSACTDNIDKPSDILLSMNRPVKNAQKSIRISMGRWSKREDFFILKNVFEDLYKNKI